MRLQGIEPGAIIRVDDGLRPWYGMTKKQPEEQTVYVAPITGPRGARTVKARDVTGIWRPSKKTDPWIGTKI